MLTKTRERERLVPVADHPEVKAERARLVELVGQQKAAGENHERLIRQFRNQQSGSDDIAADAHRLIYGDTGERLITADEVGKADRQRLVLQRAVVEQQNVVDRVEARASQAFIDASDVRGEYGTRLQAIADAAGSLHDALAAHDELIGELEAAGVRTAGLAPQPWPSHCRPGDPEEPGSVLHRWLRECREAGHRVV